VHDPWRPVPGRGGHLGPEPGLVDRRDLDGRADVACFTAAPCLEAQTLLGEPCLEVVVAADQPGFDLCVALSLVAAADGRVRQLSTGVSRFLGDGCLRPVRRWVRLQPLLARLEPGDRLRLSLAAAAWPQVAVNPGDGGEPRGAVGPDHRVITLTVHPMGSRLWFPPLLGAN
jgi:predicted acyl esterase